MSQFPWHESQIWLAAGWTMFQFFGAGMMLWFFGACLRWSLRRASPQIRYAAALLLLSAAAAIPVWLFLNAPDLAPGPTAKGIVTASAPFLPPIVETQARPAQSGSAAAIAEPPRNDVQPTTRVPLPRQSVEWRAALASGINDLQDFSCRWFPWLWLAGTPLALLVLACGVTGTSRLRRSGRPLAEGEVLAAGERLRRAIGIGRSVAIIACDRVAAPILAGIVWPAILLPPAVLAGCSPGQIEMILLHELAHVRRWDNLVNFVQRLIEAAFFFHPVVWWLSSWARLEREECCDQAVIAHTGRPQEYAEILAALALPGIAPHHAAAAMTDSQLVTRIRHILKLEDETMTVSRRAFVSAAAILVVAGGFAASIAQQSEDGPSPAEPKTPVAEAAKRGGDAVELLYQKKIAEAELPNAVQGAYLREVQEHLGQESAVHVFKAHNLADLRTVIPQLPAGTRTPVELAFDPHATGIVQLEPVATGQHGLATLLVQAIAGKPQWGPEQATGAPDSPDWPNNPGTAWCPATADGQEEWLELTYGEPIEPLVLVVYECLKPGALNRVLAFDAEGNEINAWSGKDPSPPDAGNGSAISVIPLKAKKLKIVRLRLYLDSPHIEGWNEIDAAGILDVKGAIHWATGATASSTWVHQTAGVAVIDTAEPQYTTSARAFLSRLALDRVAKPASVSSVGVSELMKLQDATLQLWTSTDFRVPLSRGAETDEDRELKATLLELNKQSWDAAGKGDATVSERLLADDYFGFYVNSTGIGRTDKATDMAAVNRRRYYDVSIRNAEVRRITPDAAILTYVYDCKVDEAGKTWTYRNHQATSVWKLKDNRWLVSFAQDFVMPGGE